MALARQFGNLRMIVQDMDKVVEDSKVPDDLYGRISFLPYYPIQGDVFIFRWITHNWPDEFCVWILKF
ncbi:Demethylsterigmatocystin 6-O-methyltransferase [Cytospora mali]|uniref:Demethylsterigmatocystin 6-O-methyltransferase n=1 Tax=Cytospora mali TaxID=578113 RepID=A0A194VSQ4_CYTMA|nr:Demethylsterigmatocystin 6-O-methyltransferase [Valsa mali]